MDVMDHVWKQLPSELSVSICMWLSGDVARQLSKCHRDEHARRITKLKVHGDFEGVCKLLQRMTALAILDLSSLPITEVPALHHLKSLRILDLSYSHIRDLAPLRDMEVELSALFLTGTKISDIAPLADMTSLRNLTLSQTAVPDISSLAGLTGLMALGIAGLSAQIDVSVLRHLTNLTGLVLMYTPISNADASVLRELKQLVYLFMKSTGITTMVPLSNLTRLTELDISHNAITSIAPLAKLTGLTSLDMSNCWSARSITDIDLLANMRNLADLRMSEHVA